MIRYKKINDKIILYFNHSIFIEKKVIERMAIYFERITKNILNNISININELKLIDENEINNILYKFNNTKKKLPKNKLVHQLFEEQVNESPNKIIIEDNGRQITNHILNSKANQLARLLRDKGVKANSIVCIIMENSIETIIGILGILKAGAAYLPIDPLYYNRIPYILKDCNCDVVLTNKQMDLLSERNKVVIRLDDEKSYVDKDSNLNIDTNPQDLAYIIYTSGTTGNPKGTMIEHCGLRNYIWYAADQYVKNESITFPLYTSISFDLTVTSIFTPLITGNKIIIYKGEQYENLVKKIIEENRVNIIKLTPSHLKLIRDFKTLNSKLKRIIVGGEELETQLAKDIYNNFGQNIEIHNEYGPTETVVGCMDYIFNPKKCNKRTVSIGTPIYNTEIYVLDDNLEPVPYDVVGEIYISGEGVGRGYLNLDELTRERFLKNPFLKNRRMYKTGDLARMTPDGLIEFCGRVDNQISLNGYRIELGEIESNLLKHPQIKEAIVIKRKVEGEKFLCAFIKVGNKVNELGIREFLAKILPNYMIPTYIVNIDKIPLTLTGKVNVHQLNAIKIKLDVEHEIAKTELQKQLVSIWEKVLGKKSLGINDNFQYIGGDSIKAIAIYAEMSKLNLKANYNDIFLHPTIKEFSKYIVTEDKIKDEQGLVIGEVVINPIQRMLIEYDVHNINHFNLSDMVCKKDGFKPKIVDETIKKIIEHHDYLRASFDFSEGKTKIKNRGLEENLYDFEIIEYLTDTDEEFQKRVQFEMDGKHLMDLKSGPLVRVVLFREQTNNYEYLFITISHLVADVVSWKILIEDFIAIYTQIEQCQKIQLPKKTTSFKKWMDKIKEYSVSTKLLDEKKYWGNILEQKIDILPKDYQIKKDMRRKKNIRLVTITFERKTTRQIIEDSSQFYQSNIKTILLTAFGLALKEWKKLQTICIEFEGHGREEIFNDINLSRTIGFFTNLFPVILELPKTNNMSHIIKVVENILDTVPDNGIGYGILKYITPLYLKKELNYYLNPEIGFNYLGELGHSDNRYSDKFVEPDFKIKRNISDELVRPYSLEVIGSIIEGKFELNFFYNTFEYKRETIIRLTELFKKSVRDILNFTHKKERICENEVNRTYNKL
jgi:bacitracin synthase 3